MTENRLESVLQFAGISKEPEVVRFYRDGDRADPSLVFQKDFQGCRIMLRQQDKPTEWTCAWFADSGDLISVERFACGNAALDRDQADEFLKLVVGERLDEMARDTVRLGKS